MKSALTVLALVLSTSCLNASILGQKGPAQEPHSLAKCDYMCIYNCYDNGHNDMNECAVVCGCPPVYLFQKNEATPAEYLQSLASIYYYDDAEVDGVSHQADGQTSSQTTTTTTTSVTHTSTASASSSGDVHAELESSGASSEVLVTGTKSSSADRGVSCTDTVATSVSAETKLSQDVKNAMVEAVLHEIFALAAQSALSGEKTIQFQTSSVSIKNDFHPQIQQVVDQEWSHATGTATTETKEGTATTTTSTSVSKDASAQVESGATSTASTRKITVAKEEDVQAAHVEAPVVEEEVIEEKTTTTTTTTSTTTDVTVEKAAAVEAEEAPAAKETTTTEAHVEVTKEATVDVAAEVDAHVEAEEKTQEVAHESTTTTTTTTTTATVEAEAHKEVAAEVESEKDVHVEAEVEKTPEVEVAGEKDVHTEVTHTITTTEASVDAHVAKEEEVAEPAKEVEANKTTTSHTTTTTTTVIEKEETIAGAHHEAAEIAIAEPEPLVDPVMETSPEILPGPTPIIEIDCCPEASISQGQIDKVSKQLQVELTLFKEELLEEMKLAISQEIDALWDMHLVEAGVSTTQVEPTIDFEVVEPEKLIQPPLVEEEEKFYLNATEPEVLIQPTYIEEEEKIYLNATEPQKLIQPTQEFYDDSHLHEVAEEEKFYLNATEPEVLIQPTHVEEEEKIYLNATEPQKLIQPTQEFYDVSQLHEVAEEEKFYLNATEPEVLIQPTYIEEEEKFYLNATEPEVLIQPTYIEEETVENKTHVHEVHVDASGEVHEVHVEEEASGNETHHAHVTQVVVETVETSTVHLETGAEQTIDAIVDAELTNVTHEVEIEEDVSAKLDVILEHEGHTHEAVKEPVADHTTLVQEETAQQEEIVTEEETNTTVTKEVHIDAHVHDAEAEQEAQAAEVEKTVEASVEQTTTTTTTTTVVEEEVAVQGDHTHTHEVVVDESESVTALIQPEEPVAVKEDTKGVCEVSTADVLAVPTVTVHTDYWTVSPCSYIDEHGEVRSGHTQKFVTETVTTIQHPSICALPEDVQVEAKSSQQRNAAGDVVQVTTVVTEQTTVTTNGKQVITIVETTTIDDVKPDEVVQEAEETAVTAEKTTTEKEVVVEEDVTVVEDKTVETAVTQEAAVEAEVVQHVESQTTYTTTTTHTETHEVSADVHVAAEKAPVEEEVTTTTTTTVEAAPSVEGEVTTTTHTEEVVTKAAEAEVAAEKEVVAVTTTDKTETKATTAEAEAVVEKDVVVAKEEAADATTTTTTQTTTTTTKVETEVAVTKPAEPAPEPKPEPIPEPVSEPIPDHAPMKQAETHKEVSKTTIVSETEEVYTGLSKSTLDSIHAATKANTTTTEPIPVEEVAVKRTGITKESTLVTEEEEVVGELHAEFETASVTKEVEHQKCSCPTAVEDEVTVIEKPSWMTCQQWTVFVEETADWSHDMKVQTLNAAQVSHNLMIEQAALAQQTVTIRADFWGTLELDVPVGFYTALLNEQMAAASHQETVACTADKTAAHVHVEEVATTAEVAPAEVAPAVETKEVKEETSVEATSTVFTMEVSTASTMDTDIQALGAMLGCADTCINECLAVSSSTEEKYSCLNTCGCASPAALSGTVETSHTKMYVLAAFAVACALAAFFIAKKKNERKEIQIGGADEETLKEPLLAH